MGLEAQKEIIKYNISSKNILKWYKDIKSGKNIDVLPELQKAVEHCKREKAILVIAKTDRLRNTQQALDLVDEMGPENVFFCNVGRNADKFTLTLFFAFAEKERLEISIRTKAALARLKAKGIKLGVYTHKQYKRSGKVKVNPELPNLGAQSRKHQSLNHPGNVKAAARAMKLRVKGWTFSAIADELNEKNLLTMTGGSWNAGSIFKLIKRHFDI